MNEKEENVKKDGKSTFALNHFVVFIASDIRAMKHFLHCLQAH